MEIVGRLMPTFTNETVRRGIRRSRRLSCIFVCTNVGGHKCRFEQLEAMDAHKLLSRARTNRDVWDNNECSRWSLFVVANILKAWNDGKFNYLHIEDITLCVGNSFCGQQWLVITRYY